MRKIHEKYCFKAGLVMLGFKFAKIIQFIWLKFLC